MFGRPEKPGKQIAAIERELAGLCSRRDTIAARITEVESQIEQHKSDAVRTALNGADPDQLNRFEGLKRSCEDRRATLNAAQSQLIAQIAEAETKLAAARDAQLRSEFLGKVAELERAIDTALPSFIDQLSALALAVGNIGTLVFEFASVGAISRHVRNRHSERDRRDQRHARPSQAKRHGWRCNPEDR